MVGIDRGLKVTQQPGQSTDMVFMAMGDENAPQLLAIVDDIGKIRNDDIDARHIIGREGNAAVDNDHVVAIFVDGHVLADLPHATERDDLQAGPGGLLCGIWPVRR